MRALHPCLVFALTIVGIIAIISGAAGDARAQESESAWNSIASGTTANLVDVFSSDGITVACGAFGTLATWDGDKWRRVATPTSLTLNAVWATSGNTAFLVGGGGTILRVDSTEVSRTPTVTSANLYGVWGRSASDVFAVGDNGTILRYDGEEWKRMSSGTSSRLRSIVVNRSRIAYAVGENGTVLRFDGSSWTREETPTTHRLNGVWMADDVVFAAGAFGTILRRQDDEWERMSTPTTMNLNDVWAVSDNAAFAVGEYGTILAFDGHDWHSERANTSRGLNGIHNGVVVGDFGSILEQAIPQPLDDDEIADDDDPIDDSPGGGIRGTPGGPSAFNSLSAIVVTGGVELQWRMETATPIAGFRIYRQTVGAGSDIELTAGALMSASTRDYTDRTIESGTSYYYWVAAIPEDGSAELRSGFASASTPAIPLMIVRIFPNPFTALTTLDFLLDRAGFVSVGVYDVQGKLVTRLGGQDFTPGANIVTWDGRTSDGTLASAGTYFVKLETRGKVLTRKIVLVR